MLRHKWAVASWAGSTGVIPRPHRKPAWNNAFVVFRRVSEGTGGPKPLKGRQCTCDSGVAGVQSMGGGRSLTIKRSATSFALLYHKKRITWRSLNLSRKVFTQSYWHYANSRGQPTVRLVVVGGYFLCKKHTNSTNIPITLRIQLATQQKSDETIPAIDSSIWRLKKCFNQKSLEKCAQNWHKGSFINYVRRLEGEVEPNIHPISRNCFSCKKQCQISRNLVK